MINHPVKGEEQVNIVIIGGGIAGHSAAYWLKKSLILGLLLLKNILGDRATEEYWFYNVWFSRALNRLVDTHGVDSQSLILVKGTSAFKNIIKDDQVQFILRKRGAFLLVSGSLRLQKTANLMSSSGIEVELINEVVQLRPVLRVRRRNKILQRCLCEPN